MVTYYQHEDREKKRNADRVVVNRNKKRRKVDSENTNDYVIKGWNAIQCPILIVGGGDDVTTLKVKGGDDSIVSEGWNPQKCLIPIVGGGEGVTTLKVKGGDELNSDKGGTPLKCTPSSHDISSIGSKPKSVPILISEKNESIGNENQVCLTRPSFCLNQIYKRMYLTIIPDKKTN